MTAFLAGADLHPWRSRSGKLYAISVAEEQGNLPLLLEAIASEGGVEDPLIARVGCRALRAVCGRQCLAEDGGFSAAGCERLAEGGGIALLVQALALHPGDEDVGACAAPALAALSASRHGAAVAAAGAHGALLGCIQARQLAGQSGARGDATSLSALAALRSLAAASAEGASPEWARMILEWGDSLRSGSATLSGSAGSPMPQWVPDLTASRAAPQPVSPVSPRRAPPPPPPQPQAQPHHHQHQSADHATDAFGAPAPQRSPPQQQPPVFASPAALGSSSSGGGGSGGSSSSGGGSLPSSPSSSPRAQGAAAFAFSSSLPFPAPSRQHPQQQQHHHQPPPFAPSSQPPAYLPALLSRPLPAAPPPAFLPSHAARAGLYAAIGAADVPYILLLMRSHASDGELQAAACDALGAIASALAGSGGDLHEAAAAPLGSCLALALLAHGGSVAGGGVEDAACRALGALGALGSAGAAAAAEAAVLGGAVGCLGSMLEAPRAHCDAGAALGAVRALGGLAAAARSAGAVAEQALLRGMLLRGAVRALVGALNDLHRGSGDGGGGGGGVAAALCDAAAGLMLALCEAAGDVFELCSALVDNGLVPVLVGYMGASLGGGGGGAEGGGGAGASAAASAAMALECLLGSSELGVTPAAAAFFTAGGLRVLLDGLKHQLLPPAPAPAPAQPTAPPRPPQQQLSPAPALCRLLYALVFNETLGEGGGQAAAGASASASARGLAAGTSASASAPAPLWSLGRHLCANWEGAATLTELLDACLGQRRSPRIAAPLAGPLLSSCAAALAAAAASAHAMQTCAADAPRPGAWGVLPEAALAGAAQAALRALTAALGECLEAVPLPLQQLAPGAALPAARSLGAFTLHACEALLVLLRNALLCVPATLPASLLKEGGAHPVLALASFWGEVEEALRSAGASARANSAAFGVVTLLLSHSVTVLGLLVRGGAQWQVLGAAELAALVHLGAARGARAALQAPLFSLLLCLALQGEEQRTALVRAGAVGHALRTLDRVTGFTGQVAAEVGEGEEGGEGGEEGGSGSSSGSGSGSGAWLEVEKSVVLLLKLFCSPVEAPAGSAAAAAAEADADADPAPASQPPPSEHALPPPQPTLAPPPPQLALAPDHSPSALALLSARPAPLLVHALRHYLARAPAQPLYRLLATGGLLQVVAAVLQAPWGEGAAELCQSGFPEAASAALGELAREGSLHLGARDGEVEAWATAVEMLALRREAARHGECLALVLRSGLPLALCAVLRGVCSEGEGGRAALPPPATPPASAAPVVQACLAALLALARAEPRAARDLRQPGGWCASLGAAVDGLGGKPRLCSQWLHKLVDGSPA